MEEQKSCSEKLTFETKKDAETAKIVAKHQRGTKLKTYKCRFCHLWHLSSDYS